MGKYVNPDAGIERKVAKPLCQHGFSSSRVRAGIDQLPGQMVWVVTREGFSRHAGVKKLPVRRSGT
jgi:hypothetical protein